jgi:2-C-methyl-D-erythritol 4-phosphate cytidylyltransferase
MLRRQPLVVHAVHALRALGSAVVVVTDGDVSALERVLDGSAGTQVLAVDEALSRLAQGRAVVLHDSRCPLLEPADLRRVAAAGIARPAAGARPVTDTVKTVGPATSGHQVTGTVDRETYRVICSPLVLPADVVATLIADSSYEWWLDDLWAIAERVRSHHGLDLVGLPGTATRVDDEPALLLLECVDEVRRMVRASAG